ncbi:hypothetical protein L204_102743 [Cryptococcus depauperatus]|nr:hypothetical protein L204_00507 [Cryptococcus depauperatus CBS 7855]
MARHVSTRCCDLKEKSRAIDRYSTPTSCALPQSLSARLSRSIGNSSTASPTLRRYPGLRRFFHATAKRDAIPLIPAGFAVVKGATLLTVATAFSRIVISFFPIGTLAAFRMARTGKWLESDAVRPSIGPESEEFYKMWCKGETPIRLTLEEANQLIDSDPDESGGLALEDNRIAYPVPMPPSKFTPSSGNTRSYSPKAFLEHNNSRKRVAYWIRRAYFIIPPLPPAAESYYEKLGAKEKEEVDSLRRYWAGLKRFKDCFKGGRWLVGIIFGLPFALILGVYLAGLERVPLTGRWRLILLTPEEEDAISTSLSGGNWYRSVINLLTMPEQPAPPILSTEDWRWRWVQGVLSRLETAALIECQYVRSEQKPSLVTGPCLSLPPPTYHPFKPRPRASSLLHSVLPGGDPSTGREHLEIGPPYNLMLLQKDEQNAFSYGFGGKKAGGIVVYTGLLDDILRHNPNFSQPTPEETPRQSLFSSIFASRPSSSSLHLQPTAEEELHLACVLAHEMGHLLLSHHLETLSQQQVLWPSVLGLGMDFARALIWPFTFFLGPTVNDALAKVGKTSTEELSEKYGEIGFQCKHEYEADLAGLRILARAGYEPRAALDHFQRSVLGLQEIQSSDKADAGLTGTVFKLWARATHPTAEQRTNAIKQELDRWQEEADLKGKSSKP